MLQILLYHCFRHLAYRGTKVPSRPEMPAPILLFQMRKLFKQLARRAPFDPPHDLTGCHIRRTTHQNMHVIFTHDTFDYPDFKSLTRLSHQISNPLRHLSISILCSDTLLPIQNGTQFETPYDCRICTPCHTSLLVAYCRS